MRNISKNLDDQRPLLVGDTVSLTGVFRNFLAPAQGVTVKLRSSSSHVQILDSVITLGNMATLAMANNNSNPFRFRVLPSALPNELIRMRFVFTAIGYEDVQFFSLTVNPDYVTLDINLVDVTVSTKGTFGYHGFNTAQGVGVRYKNRPSLLAEGGLLVGASPTKVSNAVRSGSGDHDEHFYAQQPMRFRAPIVADQEATGVMLDSAALPATLGLEIRQNAYAWQQAPNDKFVILEYEIKNTSGNALPAAYAGLYADWDLWFSTHNEAGFDASRKLGYVLSKDSANKAAGICLLTMQPTLYYALNNMAPTNATINLTDTLGFSLAEKFAALSNGVGNASVGASGNGVDVSHVLGGDLGGLQPNQTGRIAFAILAGDGLADLQQSATAAQTLYQTILVRYHTGTFAEGLLVYPNPANGQLQVRLPAAQTSEAVLELTDVLGQVVLRRALPAGTQQLQFDTRPLASGLYVLRMNSVEGVRQQRVMVQH